VCVCVCVCVCVVETAELLALDGQAVSACFSAHRTQPVFQEGDAARVASARNALYTCCDQGLRLLSVFMPFLTEEVRARMRA
jgi:isoleucyl-tRNA synthetase